MPTPDRLEAIQRELDRLAAQVARLQQEIREARPPDAAKTAGGPVRAIPIRSPQPAPATSGDPDLALNQFADAPADPNLAKRGCLAAFIGIMAGLGAVVGAVYYAFYR